MLLQMLGSHRQNCIGNSIWCTCFTNRKWESQLFLIHFAKMHLEIVFWAYFCLDFEKISNASFILWYLSRFPHGVSFFRRLSGQIIRKGRKNNHWKQPDLKMLKEQQYVSQNIMVSANKTVLEFMEKPEHIVFRYKWNEKEWKRRKKKIRHRIMKHRKQKHKVWINQGACFIAFIQARFESFWFSFYFFFFLFNGCSYNKKRENAQNGWMLNFFMHTFRHRN